MKRITVLLAAFLAVACASGPAGAQKVPSWVTDEPPPDAVNTYFVADFTETTGDAGKAETLAVGKVIDEVVKFMGVKIKAEFEGEQQATLDGFAASMRQTVTSSSEARFVGFTVKDKFVQKPKDKKVKSVTVYVLCAYETAQMNKERDRLQKMLEEQENAVLLPEAAGKTAMASGRAAEAVGHFLQAALGAATVPMDNREARLQRTMTEATNALSALRLVRVSGPASVKLGEAPAVPFVAKVVSGEDDKGPGVPGAKVVVQYEKKQPSGRTVTKSESAVTGPDGTVSFTPPAYDFAGKSKFRVSLDLSAELRLLDGIPAQYEAATDAFRSTAVGKTVEFPFIIGSDSKAMPFMVAVADIGADGSVLGLSAQGAILQAMAKDKWSAKASAAAKDIAMGDDPAAAAAAARSSGAKRAITGRVTVESVNKDGSSFIAQVKAVLSVIDADGGDVLLQVEKSAMGIGSTEAQAISAGLGSAGQAAAKQIMSSL